MSSTKLKIPKWIIIVFIILLLLVLIMTNTPSNEEEKNNTTTLPQTTVSTTKNEIKSIKVDAKDLISDYNENESTANTKYKNNQLVVCNAIVYSVDKNYVQLECSNDNFWLDYIDAYYNSDQTNSVSSLQKGDKITVIGECKGLSSWGNVKLWN